MATGSPDLPPERWHNLPPTPTRARRVARVALRTGAVGAFAAGAVAEQWGLGAPFVRAGVVLGALAAGEALQSGASLQAQVQRANVSYKALKAAQPRAMDRRATAAYRRDLFAPIPAFNQGLAGPMLTKAELFKRGLSQDRYDSAKWVEIVDRQDPFSPDVPLVAPGGPVPQPFVTRDLVEQQRAAAAAQQAAKDAIDQATGVL